MLIRRGGGRVPWMPLSRAGHLWAGLLGVASGRGLGERPGYASQCVYVVGGSCSKRCRWVRVRGVGLCCVVLWRGVASRPLWGAVGGSVRVRWWAHMYWATGGPVPSASSWKRWGGLATGVTWVWSKARFVCPGNALHLDRQRQHIPSPMPLSHVLFYGGYEGRRLDQGEHWFPH
jgi:hypothetical protein